MVEGLRRSVRAVEAPALICRTTSNKASDMHNAIKVKRERDTLLAAAKVTDQTLLQVELALGDHWTRAKEKIGGDDWLAVFREAISPMFR
jgi:hypothetical protein